MYTLSSLQGMHRCTQRRDNNVNKADKKNIFAIRNTTIAECIYGCLANGLTETEAKAKIAEIYKEDEETPEALRQISIDDIWIYVSRYLKSETRVPQLAPESPLNIYGVDVVVKPDMFFFDGYNLEIVKFFYKKPDMTQTGKKLDGSANGSLALYALLYYGKQLVPYLGVNQTISVKASFYYLKKKNDSFKNGIFDLDFFDIKDGKNIISLKDTSTYPSYTDNHFYQLFTDFKAGQKMVCTKEICKNCSLYQVCSFKKTPLPIVKESLKKPVKMNELTKGQQQAINHEFGIARINAGAGAGKTMVIGLRVANLLAKGYQPNEICVLSFANSSANEMTERINNYANEYGISDKVNMETLLSKTFNSLGDDIIAENYLTLGYSEPPTLIESGERSSIIEELILADRIDDLDYRNFRADEINLKGALAIAKKVFDIFKTYRIMEIDNNIDFVIKKLDADASNVTEDALRQLHYVYNKYKQVLFENNYIEYADQEWLLFDLARMNSRYFQSTGIKHIIVDEFQDSNEKQMNIIKLLMQSSCFTSLMVVGDDSQSIYGFRDTSPYNIIHFFDIIGTRGTDFYLLENHRSTPEIIRFANEHNKRNKNRIPKDLIATRPSIGKHPVVQAFRDNKDEYIYVINEIKEQLKKGRKPEDIAFIAATKSELLKMEELLDAADIPCVILAPEKTNNNPKVQAAMSVYSFLHHPEDEAGVVGYLNCLLKGKFFDLSPKERDDYLKYYKEYLISFQDWPAESKYIIFNQLVDALAYEEDEVFESFRDSLKRYKTWNKVCRYLYNFSIYGDENTYTKKCNYPGITLTTAHTSKGLEWPVVFNSITKYDNELLHAPSRADELEEKRRLLFVSATRAREELFVTGKYYSYGTMKEPNFNVFLADSYTIMGKNIEVEYDKIMDKKSA